MSRAEQEPKTNLLTEGVYLSRVLYSDPMIGSGRTTVVLHGEPGDDVLDDVHVVFAKRSTALSLADDIKARMVAGEKITLTITAEKRD